MLPPLRASRKRTQISDANTFDPAWKVREEGFDFLPRSELRRAK